MGLLESRVTSKAWQSEDRDRVGTTPTRAGEADGDPGSWGRESGNGLDEQPTRILLDPCIWEDTRFDDQKRPLTGGNVKTWPVTVFISVHFEAG